MSYGGGLLDALGNFLSGLGGSSSTFEIEAGGVVTGVRG